MSLKQTLEKHGATPGKLALVGVLCLVLVVVVVRQLPESAPSVPRAVAAKPQGQPKGESKPSPQKTKEKKELPAWPQKTLHDALASNPFKLPVWARQLETEAVASGAELGDLLEIQQQGASVVVIGDAVKSASVGEQTYYVGDVLEGYRVVDITTQGILLDKIDSR